MYLILSDILSISKTISDGSTAFPTWGLNHKIGHKKTECEKVERQNTEWSKNMIERQNIRGTELQNVWREICKLSLKDIYLQLKKDGFRETHCNIFTFFCEREKQKHFRQKRQFQNRIYLKYITLCLLFVLWYFCINILKKNPRKN